MYLHIATVVGKLHKLENSTNAYWMNIAIEISNYIGIYWYKMV